MKNFSIISCCFFLASCASITKGTSQTIVFNIEPKDSTCQVTRDGDGEIGSISSSNNMLKVSKDKDDIIIKCLASGYKQKKGSKQECVCLSRGA